MIKNKYRILYLIFISFMIFISGCSHSDSVETKAQTITIHETENAFLSDYKQLTSPKGIMPTTKDIGRGDKNIILKVPDKFYEYFVYDRDTALIVLSFNPFFYIKIKSRTMSAYLDAEYTQFYSNVRLAPADKQKSAAPFFEKIGNVEIAVLFTPSQLCYDTIGEKKMIIKGNPSIPSPSDILNSAAGSLIYTPKLEETSLYASLHSQINSGLNRFLYTTDSDSSLPAPLIYNEVAFNLNFSFFAFAPVKSGDGGTLLKKDYNQCVLFSVPLGNTGANDKNYLNLYHGIVVIIKGNIEEITAFLGSKGFDFVNPPPVYNILQLSEDNGNNPSIKLDWILDSNFKIEYRRGYKNPETNADYWYDGTWTVLSSSVSGKTFTHTGNERGFRYYYRITDNVSGSVAAKDIVIAKDPDNSVTTTRDENNGVLTGDLAFTEMLLIGSLEENYNPSGTTWVKRPDSWIEIKNISNKIIRLNNVNFYYILTDEGVTQENLLFGPALGDGSSSIEAVIYPGEYYVISEYMDYVFSEMFIYNISFRNFPVLPDPNGNDPDINNTIMMKIGSSEIHRCDTDGTRGLIAVEGCHSHVYAKAENGIYEWLNCKYPFVNINPNSAYALINLCTPGFKDTDYLVEY